MSAALPPAPRRGRPAPPRRRPALTRERIVAAAMAVLDARGLDGVSMRSVAESLGTGPATLYAHVADKDDLLALLLDQVLGGLALPEPAHDRDRWQEQLKAIARAVHYGLLAHRDLARAALAEEPLGAGALRLRERMLDLLRLGTLPDPVVAHGCGVLWLYAVATAFERARHAPGDERFAGEVGAYLAALPRDRFPNVVALAGPLAAGAEQGERFEFGLDVLVSGLAAYGRVR